MNKYIEYNNQIKQRDEDGFYNLEADKEALSCYLSTIKSKSKHFVSNQEKFQWLIDNNYYIDFFNEEGWKYNPQEVYQLQEDLYNYGFEFQSFMAANKFYEGYALQTLDRKIYLENYEDRILACSLFLARGDINYARDLAFCMIKQEYQPATPTFLNSGKKHAGELISCFLMQIDDSLNSINYTLSTAMQLSKIGGGVAIDLTRLRGRGEEIKGNAGVGRGVLPVMKLLEDAFNYVDQLGQRPGAGAAYLNIFHSDVLDFLDTKKINADEKNRIQTLSIGLNVPDKFMELAKANADMHLFYPYTIYKKYGKYLDEIDMNEMYDTLVEDPDVKSKVIKARDLLQTIAITQFESGYPYLMFIDNANNQHALSDIGQIKMSNLCTEIFQLQTVSDITDYGSADNIGYDVVCNLGSLNIVNLMENKDVENAIDIAMNALTSVSDMSDIDNAPGMMRANNDFHAVGLGVMNLHGYLTKNQIAYESDVAKEFVNILFAMINYYSIKSSIKIARKKNETFRNFGLSDYYTGKYFEKYINVEADKFLPKSDKVKALFEGIDLPTIEDWKKLRDDARTYGMYHAYRLAIAPTQSISYVQNATASIQPIVDVVETRMYGNSVTYYPMPFISRENLLFYKSAYFMNQEKIIDLVAEAQQHVDQGISTVLYVTSDASTKDLVRLYYYAWKKGLKSIYYVRTKNLTLEECETCSV